MTEYQIALNKILALNQLIKIPINERSGKQSIVRKCKQISYNQLKAISLESKLPFISYHDQIKYEERKSWNSFWILSPIIGQKQLREGKSDFVIGITKVVKQRPTFGLLLVPQKGELFIGIKHKAYKIESLDLPLNIDIYELLTSKNRIKPTEGFFFTIMKNKFQMNAKTEKFIDDFKLYKEGALQVKIDESPLNLLGLTEGKYDFYPHLKSIYEWDIAPFDAVVTASGNRITQGDGILPLFYNSETLKFDSFIAKNNFDTGSIDLVE